MTHEEAFGRLARLFTPQPTSWGELVPLLTRAVVASDPHAAALAAIRNDSRTPTERFQRMVDSGLICPQGCVRCGGNWPHEPERHIFPVGTKVRWEHGERYGTGTVTELTDERARVDWHNGIESLIPLVQLYAVKE